MKQYMYTHIRIHPYIHTYIHTYIQTYVRTYVHTRDIHIHTRTYIHITIYHLDPRTDHAVVRFLLIKKPHRNPTVSFTSYRLPTKDNHGPQKRTKHSEETKYHGGGGGGGVGTLSFRWLHKAKPRSGGPIKSCSD